MTYDSGVPLIEVLSRLSLCIVFKMRIILRWTLPSAARMVVAGAVDMVDADEEAADTEAEDTAVADTEAAEAAAAMAAETVMEAVVAATEVELAATEVAVAAMEAAATAEAVAATSEVRNHVVIVFVVIIK